MKVTTEKLPKSLLALDIELERDQLEKGLDRAARRLSQKYTVPGFRKGKAPRFIIENYFGRAALLEEATDDLVNKAYRQALEEQQINPVGPGNLISVDPSEIFRFRITVPIPPTTIIPDYRAIQVPLEIEPVTDEMVNRAMEVIRDKHIVLKELEEPRPAQQGDQLMVRIETIVEGETLEQHEEDAEVPETPLVLEPDRLVDDLYQGLLGINIDEQREISAAMPEDHPNEEVRGKQVTFKVHVTGIQERLLPEWDELTTLEEFEGSIDELRDQTRHKMEQTARSEAEKQLIDSYIDTLVEQTEYDLPDVMIREMADEMLENQAHELSRYGITLDQMLTYRGQTREAAQEMLLPEAENQLKVRLALRAVVQREQLNISENEIESEVQELLQEYAEEQREDIAKTMSEQIWMSIANAVLNRKLQERLIAIATGTAPPLPEPGSAEAGEEGEETTSLAAEPVAAATPEVIESAETPVAETLTDEEDMRETGL